MRTSSVDHAVSQAVSLLVLERPRWSLSAIEAAARYLRMAVTRWVETIPLCAVRALAARSSLVLRALTVDGDPVIFKAPVLLHQLPLEVAALDSWAGARLVPLLYEADGHTMVMAASPGIPLYQTDQRKSVEFIADWYTRCHCHPAQLRSVALDLEATITEWLRWLDRGNPIVSELSERAASEVLSLCSGLPRVITHGDPNSGNFLLEAAAAKVVAVDPLPVAIPPELIFARAALQIFPSDSSFFLETVYARGVNREVVEHLLPPLAVLTADWAPTAFVMCLAESFRQSTGQ